METNDLIYLVSCAVNENTPDAERIADMDLEALYKLASRHYLAAVVAPVLKVAGVNDENFDAAFKSSVLKNATMDMEMVALFKELDAAGIWHMPLKGTLLQHLYPIYGMRQMSDHDILFDAGRAEDVRNIFEKLGFQTERFGPGLHDVYHKLPVSNFEMHRVLFDPVRNEKMAIYYRDVEKRLLGDGYEKHLSPEDFYVYMIAHEYKHFSVEGTGLRSLLDTYVYLQKEKPDMDYIITEAEKLGIAEFEVSNRSLAQHLFFGGELTEADREMLEYILSSGVYGTRTNYVQNRLSKFGHGKIYYVLKRFAEPLDRKSWNYNALSQEFPFFYKHKALLPCLMVYRVFLRMKEGKLKAEMKALRKSKGEGYHI